MAKLITNIAQSIVIPSEKVTLDGILFIPKTAEGIVVFAHGSGSSRLSVRNQAVATVFNKANLATLLFDLLTPDEEAFDDQTRVLRFDIPFLARRLISAMNWIEEQTALQNLAVGLFGASTGGGAALMAAAKQPERVKAIVSRGGRPDLAGAALKAVRAPTLLIVGGNDEGVIELNQEALAQLTCTKQLTLVPGATHLFEEPGALDAVARLATEWFENYLKNSR